MVAECCWMLLNIAECCSVKVANFILRKAGKRTTKIRLQRNVSNENEDNVFEI